MKRDGKRGRNVRVRTPQDVARFTSLYTDPVVKIRTIARTFDIAESTICDTAKRLGLPLRKAGRPCTRNKVGRTARIDTLIRAAVDLMDYGSEVFTEANLAVMAWRIRKDLFGLKGYENTHPDNKRVSCELVVTRKSGILRQGFLERVGPGEYRITALGCRVAANLKAGRKRYEDAKVSNPEVAHDVQIRTFETEQTQDRAAG